MALQLHRVKHRLLSFRNSSAQIRKYSTKIVVKTLVSTDQALAIYSLVEILNQNTGEDSEDGMKAQEPKSEPKDRTTMI